MHVQLNPDNTAIKGTTGLPSSVWVVCCAFTIVSSVYQTSETKGKFRAYKTGENTNTNKKLLPHYFALFFCVYFGDLRPESDVFHFRQFKKP